LKHKHLYPNPRTEIICWKDEKRFFPSGNNAAVMWASSLGSSQTTPSTSAQAAPAPGMELDTQVMTLSAWLELLTNQVTERCYDC
jgi:hypothetical protein